MASTGDQGKKPTVVVVRDCPLKYQLSKLNVLSNQETVMSKKILMRCGDYGEDDETMVPFQAMLAIGYTVLGIQNAARFGGQRGGRRIQKETASPFGKPALRVRSVSMNSAWAVGTSPAAKGLSIFQSVRGAICPANHRCSRGACSGTGGWSPKRPLG